MNFTPLEEAYNIHHVSPNTYAGAIQYITVCIFCNYPESISLMKNDGGAFRQCNRCKKHFTAKLNNNAITNYLQSTGHLKGTN